MCPVAFSWGSQPIRTREVKNREVSVRILYFYNTHLAVFFFFPFFLHMEEETADRSRNSQWTLRTMNLDVIVTCHDPLTLIQPVFEGLG